jgi:hypothetical protein
MKRLIFMILLVALLAWIIERHLHEPAQVRFVPTSQRHQRGAHPAANHNTGRQLALDNHRQIADALFEARQAVAKARMEIYDAFADAHGEARGAFSKAHHAVATAKVFAGPDTDQTDGASEVCEESGRIEAEGVPVRIVPRTRVTTAVSQTPLPRHTPVGVQSSKSESSSQSLVTQATFSGGETASIAGQISATEKRAKNEAIVALEGAVRDWLEPEVPRSWIPANPVLQAMVLKTTIKTVPKDYGPMYVATMTYDSSPSRRISLIDAYNRELVRHRLAVLGGALAFLLVSLGAISGYIRADEATKGYYTNRLRILAAAAIGAAGAVIYEIVA